MDRTCVRINIFPEGTNLAKTNNYDESLYGKVFSDASEIRVNEVVEGYSILYTADVFKDELETEVLGENIINLFIDNLPDTIIEIEIYYYYIGSRFDSSCAMAIMNLDEYFQECENEYIEYQSSPSTDFIASRLHDDGEEDDDDDLDDDEDDEDQFGIPDIPRPKVKKKNYGRSRVLRESKNARKNIKRHGVIISPSKEAKKRDRKILQEFLKDFMPGKSKWIKEYREETLKRWMTMYVVSKSYAKRVAKIHRAERRKKRSPIANITKEAAIGLGTQLFQGYDPFYDPKR